jgi:hypothetical protein
MHIEPGVVDGAKLVLGTATGVASVGIVAKLAVDHVKQNGNILALVGRSAAASAMVLGFFEFLPHPPVGVSEVHLILGTTLFLILGTIPTAIGLIFGLVAQSFLFSPSDIPQLGMNLTTLILPVLAMAALAQRIIPADTPYTEVTYGQAAKLSAVFQGGIVAWVAFWVFYGQGFTAETLANAGAFASVYIIVVLLEPIIDLGALALAKTFRRFENTGLPHARLYQPA